MKITHELIIDTLDEFQFHEHLNISLQNITDENLLNKLPSQWRDLFSGKKNTNQFIESSWYPLAKSLPTTIDLLKKKVKKIALLEKQESRGFSLLYLFLQNDSLHIRIANPPAFELPELFTEINYDIKKLYQVHNGFIDLISKDAGFLPLENIEIFTNQETGGNSFLKIFGNGPNSLGFDLEDNNKTPYIIWGADDDIEIVDDFWIELDEWIAADIEDFDDA
ncbi:MAG: hypothetical protein OEM38_11560 [Gammaproteobacteria bacterium]|nr:hypothetical protein [Gammaproteobacteria bacterium]